VKAWGYALGRLRDGSDEARVVDSAVHASIVDRSIDLAVVIAPPKTPVQERVYDEAHTVFKQVGAQIDTLENVDAVGARAAELLARKP
jgi:hypothetical protein